MFLSGRFEDSLSRFYTSRGSSMPRHPSGIDEFFEQVGVLVSMLEALDFLVGLSHGLWESCVAAMGTRCPTSSGL